MTTRGAFNFCYDERDLKAVQNEMKKIEMQDEIKRGVQRRFQEEFGRDVKIKVEFEEE